MSDETAKTAQPLGLRQPEKLDDQHDFSGFDCGEITINDYAHRASKAAKSRHAVIYVACELGTMNVKGFYTLSSGSVQRDLAPKNLQRNAMNEFPVTILGRLGVDKTYQGLGVGLDLLQDALTRAIHASEIVGSRAVLVHALDPRLAAFYIKHAGFKPSPVSPLTLFMSL